MTVSDAARADFRPWRRDYVAGMLLSALAMTSGVAAVLLGNLLMAVFLSTWLAIRGHQRLKRGLARERGIEIERAAIARLNAALLGQGYGIESDIQLRWGGNVDLALAPPWTTARFAVEIKAYKGILSHGRHIAKVGSVFPLWRPLHQVRGQCRRLAGGEYFPVIWLPESPLDQHFTFQGVLIVNGGVHRLLAALQVFDYMVPRSTTIEFSAMPPEEYRTVLKTVGFRFDGVRWRGTLDRTAFARIKDAFNGLDLRYVTSRPCRTSQPFAGL